MKNKKTVMAVSALLILVYHLWINTFNNEIENGLKQISFIGVDMFFFVSGFSLAKRVITDYKGFVLSRFKAIYVRFILYAAIAFFVMKWSVVRLFQVVLGIELFVKGGGAFLWFLPAIMLVYIFFSIFQRKDLKSRRVTLLVGLVGWIIIALAAYQITGYRALYILWNRIPVFLLGYYWNVIITDSSVKPLWDKWIVKMAVGGLFLVIGIFPVYRYAMKMRLQTPIPDMFYIAAIPLTLGCVILLDFIPENKIIKMIGSSTLEMYALQMIFGYKISNILIRNVDNVLVVNISTIAVITIMAIAANYIYRKLVYFN